MTIAHLLTGGLGAFGVGGDYPDEDDVRVGVIYDSGNLTGNLTLPGIGDVRLDTNYGTHGTELTGTLIVSMVSVDNPTCFDDRFSTVGTPTIMALFGEPIDYSDSELDLSDIPAVIDETGVIEFDDDTGTSRRQTIEALISKSHVDEPREGATLVRQNLDDDRPFRFTGVYSDDGDAWNIEFSREIMHEWGHGEFRTK